MYFYIITYSGIHKSFLLEKLKSTSPQFSFWAVFVCDTALKGPWLSYHWLDYPCFGQIPYQECLKFLTFLKAKVSSDIVNRTSSNSMVQFWFSGSLQVKIYFVHLDWFQRCCKVQTILHAYYFPVYEYLCHIINWEISFQISFWLKYPSMFKYCIFVLIEFYNIVWYLTDYHVLALKLFLRLIITAFLSSNMNSPGRSQVSQQKLLYKDYHIPLVCYKYPYLSYVLIL